MTQNLISITHPDRPLDEALLDRPGAFLWWYLDLLDDRGNGAVLIWSWGLPFLPGLASAARKERRTTPRSRPSLTISVYQDFELECYTLQEYDEEQAIWCTEKHEGDERAQRWQFGENVIRVWRTGLDVPRGAERVHIEVDVQERVPGSLHKLIGHVRAEGVARTPSCSMDAPEDEAGHEHDWSPLLGPAHGSIDLYHGQTHYAVQGRAYHDRNGAPKPLHDLGFEHWIWGRIPAADRELIYYVLWPSAGGAPQCVAMEILSNGESIIHEDVSVRAGKEKRALAGMRLSQHVDLFVGGARWCSIDVQSVVDDGPFYLRFFIMAKHERGRSLGYGEACTPARIDLDHHRPLVQMRVGQAKQSDSIWRPLFTGPRQGRVERLFTQFLPGNAR